MIKGLAHLSLKLGELGFFSQGRKEGSGGMLPMCMGREKMD